MIVKLCGISAKCDLEKLPNLDMVGFNFYPKSKRYLNDDQDISWLNHIAQDISRVGLFVNESITEITNKINLYKLDTIQLHGEEDIDFCRSIKKQAKVIKAFALTAHTDFKKIAEYSDVIDYYLFDTKVGTEFGGTGQKFDWSLLKHLKVKKPYLIAGGIGPDDVSECLKFKELDGFAGVDINSKFEIAPAHKDMNLVSTFVSEVRKI